MNLSRVTCLIAATMAIALSGAARADKPLAELVPGEVDFMTESMPTDKDDFLEAHWKRVMGALRRSGVVDTLIAIIGDTLPTPEAREAFNTQFPAIRARFDKLPIDRMGSGGTVTALRVPQILAPAPGPDGTPMMFADVETLVLFRSDEATAAETVTAVKDIFDHFRSLAEGMLIVAHEPVAGGEDLSLQTPSPFRIEVRRRDRDLIVSFGSGRIGGEALALREGTGAGTPLVATERFRAAFAGLPEAERSRTFFDHARLMGAVTNITTFGMTLASMAAEDPEQANMLAMAKTLTDRLLAEAACYETVASTERMEGTRVISETALRFGERHKRTLFYRAVASQPGVADWEKWVPADVSGFSVSAAADLPLLVREARGMIEMIPQNDELRTVLAQAETSATLALGFNPIEDLLPEIRGGTISVAGRPTAPGMPPPAAMVMGVRDGEKFGAMLEQAITRAQAFLAEAGNPMNVSPRTDLGPNMRAIMSPVFLLAGATQGLIVGMHENHMVMGTSPDLVRAMLETRAGNRPNITTAALWSEQGFTADRAPLKASYSDTSNTAMQASMALQQASIGALMVSSQAPPWVGRVLSLLPRLVPVANELNFFRSEAATTWVEDGVWRSRTVKTYAP